MQSITVQKGRPDPTAKYQKYNKYKSYKEASTKAYVLRNEGFLIYLQRIGHIDAEYAYELWIR